VQALRARNRSLMDRLSRVEAQLGRPLAGSDSPFSSSAEGTLWSLMRPDQDDSRHAHARPPGPPARPLPVPRIGGTGIMPRADDDDDLMVEAVELPHREPHVPALPLPPPAGAQASSSRPALSAATVLPRTIDSRSRTRSEEDEDAEDDGEPASKKIRVLSSTVPVVGTDEATELQNEAAVEKIRQSITCPVCLGPVSKLATTRCGHLFCNECIRRSVSLLKSCPTCRNPLQLGDIVKIFF
jgi:hypothetical protein